MTKQDTLWRKIWFTDGATYRVLRDPRGAEPLKHVVDHFVPGETVRFSGAVYNFRDGLISYDFLSLTETGSSPGRRINLLDDESEPDWSLYFEQTTD